MAHHYCVVLILSNKKIKTLNTPSTPSCGVARVASESPGFLLFVVHLLLDGCLFIVGALVVVPPGDPSIGRKVEERFTDQPTQPFFSRNKLAICVAVLLFSPICVCIHTDILPLARDIPAANQTLDSHTSTRVQRRVPLRSVKFGASCIVQDAGTMSAVVLILALEHVAIAIVECAVALHPITLELAYIPAASALIPTLFFLMITVACSIVPSTQQTTKTMPSILA